MSVSQAAGLVEKAVGHDGSSVTAQDVANYKETGDASQTMKALAWQGKNKVEMGMLTINLEAGLRPLTDTNTV
jgi:predicted transcriptional regulator YheO